MPDVVIPGLTFDDPLPDAPVDGLLNAGSLLLYDPAHPTVPWAAGVPVPGDTIPNLAWKQAAAIIGAGTETSLKGGVSSTFVQGTGSGKDGVIERTAKGALHFIPSQVNDTAGHLYSLLMSEDIRGWLNSHPSATVYLGASIRVTRKGGASALQNMIRIGQNGSTLRQSIAELTNSVVSGNPTSGATFVGRNFISSPGEGVVAVTTTAAAVTTIIASLTFAGPASATYLHKAPSWILEDLYIELPALSGLTHDQILARQQERRANRYKPGGVLYGDTWTNPTAVP
ncbi:hypothetical protein AB0230_01745 [Microbacterium sp. NPDC089190]|uniref:hypothetical protein n=1 Tax=Microbacterium sp. NPDC089190 TaxID=3155063 RepID=UPI00344DEB24